MGCPRQVVLGVLISTIGLDLTIITLLNKDDMQLLLYAPALVNEIVYRPGLLN
jgi:hypothetical protein